MKKLALVFLALLIISIFIIGALVPKTEVVRKSDYLKLQDSIESLVIKQKHTQDYIIALKDSTAILNDSIENLLVRPMMTADQFIQLYKYGRLEKYYRICKKSPSQWKYYKGWSIRVFEQ